MRESRKKQRRILALSHDIRNSESEIADNLHARSHSRSMKVQTWNNGDVGVHLMWFFCEKRNTRLCCIAEEFGRCKAMHTHLEPQSLCCVGFGMSFKDGGRRYLPEGMCMQSLRPIKSRLQRI